MKKTVYVGAMIFIIVIVVAASLSSMPSPRKRKESKDYFKMYIVDYYGVPIESQFCLELIICNIEPILGDATNAYIPCLPGMAKEPLILGDIPKGTNSSALFEFQYPVFLHPTENGYLFSFRIICEEAEGEVTVDLYSSS